MTPNDLISDSTADVPALATPSNEPVRGELGLLALLLVVALVMAIVGLNGGADLEITDAWVAQTAREMQNSGDWVIPRFCGEPRLHKSPAPYWAAVIVSNLRGQPVDEFSARLPSAMCGVVFVMSVYLLARAMAGITIARYAGFACVSSICFLFFTHRAASDLGVAAWCTLGLTCFWIGAEQCKPGWQRGAIWMCAYLAAGIGMLWKMPMPIVCVGMPAVLYVVIRKRWSLLFNGWHLLGLVIFVACWAPWVYAVYRFDTTALAKWDSQFLGRFTGDMAQVEGQRSLGFLLLYPAAALVFSIPFALSIPAGIARTLRERERFAPGALTYLLTWAISLFIFFSAAAGKETRYFLPVMPPLFIMLAVELRSLFAPGPHAAPRRVAAVALLIFLACPIGFIAGGFGLEHWRAKNGIFSPDEIWTGYIGTAVIFTLGAWITIAWYWKRSKPAAFGLLVATMLATWLWSWTQFAPVLRSQFLVRDFATQLRDSLAPDQREHLYYGGSQDPRIIWYSGIEIPRVIPALTVLEMQGGERSLAREERIYAERMVEMLHGDELVLLVMPLEDYQRFVTLAPMMLASEENPFPETHLWIETQLGKRRKRHHVVFSNQPPPANLDPPAPLGDED